MSAEPTLPTDITRTERLPLQPVDKSALLDRIDALRGSDAGWREGKCFALVYSAGEEHHDFLTEAHNKLLFENGLNPMAFKSLKQMESEVTRMTANLLHGGPDAVGVMTSGGTESLLLAVKTYRNYAKKKRPWVRRPNMVLPKTAHVAFDKAGHYFGVKPKYVPVTGDFRVDMKAMAKAIDRNTIMLAASAPQYPHGVIDPIEAIGKLAQKHKLPFHVDACVGGFLLPFLEKLGRPIPTWDFRVPGVTSISADLHKYGYCAKGASTITYRSMDYMKHQFFITTDWPGGIYASPGIPGTRPGGPIAAAWAGLQALGEQGFLGLCERALKAADQIRAGVNRLDGVKILGTPDATLLAIGSDDEAVDIYAVADQLNAKGWHFDRQQHPSSIHLTVMSAHLDTADEFLRDLDEAVQHVRANPELKSSGDAAMYGMMAKIPVRTMVKTAVLQVMEGMYSPEGQVPDLGEKGAAGDGLIGKIIDNYQAPLLEGLDKLEKAKDRLRSLRG
jgi:sphinganine-1-phosphate aldolase